MMWQRLKNLWKLSEFRPLQNGELMIPGDTANLVKITSQPAQVIPYKRRDPIKEIVDQTP